MTNTSHPADAAITGSVTAPPRRINVEPAFRVPEVARHLDVDPAVIYRAIHNGDLRVVRIGRLIRVPESALAAFLAGDAS